MIRRIVDFALNNRFLVLAAALMLFIWGMISFHRLPVEAYPDVANNYVQVITQWPGQAAEEVEQQVTIPLEIVMNGIPHLVHLRSVSLAGLSSLNLVFDDESENDWNRAKVLERLAQVTLPPGLQPQMGTDWSPVGPDLFLHPAEQQSADRRDGSEVAGGLGAGEAIQVGPQRGGCLELWRAHARVPGAGGPRQAGFLRAQHRAGGAATYQQQPQRGGKIHRGGLAADQCPRRGPGHERGRHSGDGDQNPSGTPIRIKDIAVVAQGPKVRLGQFGRAIRRDDGRIIDNDDVVSGIVLLRKGAESDSTLVGIHQKVEELNNQILPPGVKVVPFIDRSDLVEYTTHTVLHNLTEGIILVVIILFLFLGNARGALIVALTIPFSLLFASICLDLKHIPANLLSLGALDFGMVVDGAVVMVENIVRHLVQSRRQTNAGTPKTTSEIIREAAHEVQRPVFYAIGIIITAYLPIFTLQRVEGRLFKPMAWTVAFALLGALLFSMILAPVLASFLFRKGVNEWPNPVISFLTARYRSGVRWAILHRAVTLGVAGVGILATVYLAVGGAIGSEFLPHLDEGALWVRGTLPPSTGPAEGILVANRARVVLASFPEVTTVTSQVGRPDDGTDTTGFFNTEYCVDLKPKEQWRPVFHENKEEVIAAMDREIEKIPGAIWNFSQPIADNMEEAVSGVKGELATKVYGDDLHVLEEKGDQIVEVMRHVRGIQDLGLFRVLGQPNLNFAVDRRGRRPLGNQRRRCPGCHSDGGGRQRSDPGASGRKAL